MFESIDEIIELKEQKAKPEEEKELSGKELDKWVERELQIVRVVRDMFKQFAGREMTLEEFVEYRKLWKEGTPKSFVNFRGEITKTLRTTGDYLRWKGIPFNGMRKGYNELQKNA